MLSYKLRALAVGLVLLAAIPAAAQSSTEDEQDIVSALNPISGPDSINRVLATEAALKSNSHLLRSLALEKALQSSDGRVREVALIYLVDIQKQFIVNLEITPDSLSSIDNPEMKRRFLAMNPLTVIFDKLDKNTLTLTGHAAPEVGNFIGAINQAGLTTAVSPFNLNCQLVFRGVAGGALRGALTCGALSFSASTPLP